MEAPSKRILILAVLVLSSCAQLRQKWPASDARYYAQSTSAEIKNYGVGPINQPRNGWAEEQDKNPYTSAVTAGISYLISKDKEPVIRGQILCKKRSYDAVPFPCPPNVKIQLLDSQGNVVGTQNAQERFSFWVEKEDVYRLEILPRTFKSVGSPKPRISVGDDVILTVVDTKAS